jgi:hypothetical protein|tara:strand:- start:477 stop:800 length:324 start_codon:yes stop_codon:yes gene_type:complete
MAADNCHRWDSTDIKWSLVDFTWNEICVADAIIGKKGGGYSEQFKRLRQKSKKEQKTFIKLLCKIKGEEYEETKYFRPDVRVRAGDFKIIEKFLEKPEISIFINKEN